MKLGNANKLISVCVVTTLTGFWISAPVSAGTYRALLVGVNQYHPTWGVPDIGTSEGAIRGCLLSDSYRWQAGNITMINGPNATKDNIRNNIATLAAACVSGDVVVFYYRSYGAYEGSTPTGVSKLFTFGGPSVSADYYYHDTELASDLSAFASGVTIVCMIDASYSEGMFTKPGEPAQAPVFPIAESVMRHMEAMAKQKQGAPKGPMIGWIGSARLNETSTGVLSPYIVDAMTWDGFTWLGDANNDKQLTAYEIFIHARALVIAAAPAEHPTSWGNSVLQSTIILGLGVGTVNFSSATYTTSEDESYVTITVTRNSSVSTGMKDGSFEVNYATADGTATAGSDYTATTGTLRFENGETFKQFTVPILDDAVVETDETFTITLSGLSGGGTLGTVNPTTVTIEDNDGPGTFSFLLSNFQFAENCGIANITVLRRKGTVGSASVDYATSDGTALAGTDYGAASGTLSFLAGESSKTFPVTINDNGTTNADKVFNVTLSGPSAGSFLGTPNPSTVTILDDETRAYFVLRPDSTGGCALGGLSGLALPALLLLLGVTRRRRA